MKNLIAAVLVVGLVQSAGAILIDFEGGSDDAYITAATFAAQGIKFVTPRGNFLAFEDTVYSELGSPLDSDQGFVTDTAPTKKKLYDRDMDDTHNLDDFFMRNVSLDPKIPWTPTLDPFFQIEYLVAPVGFISGQIWDIDGYALLGTERWEVVARDKNGNDLGVALESPEGRKNDAKSLDGKAWEFSFTDLTIIPDIRFLDFNFTGTKTKGIGFALDNLETGTETVSDGGTTLALMGMALLGVAALRRRIGC